jgi:dolichol-phosphate mannosyltransferase
MTLPSKKIVVTPTFNEKENIEKMIRKVFSLSSDFHLLIVDDSSPDGTGEIVEALQQEFEGRLHLERRKGKLGLGSAYVHGFRWALSRGYKYIFEMDCDFSHNPDDLLRLLAACKDEGYDLAIGSRYVTGVNVVNWPMSRVLMSYYASAYVRTITGMTIRDTTAGFKCFTDKALRKILEEEPRFIGYAFQIEMKFRAWKYGFGIKEVPIIFTDRMEGESKMNGKISKEALFGVIEMKIRSWFKKWN